MSYTGPRRSPIKDPQAKRNLVQYLETWRLEHNYTQSEMARHLGVSLAQLHKWMRGTAMPAGENFVKLANGLNVTEQALAVGDLPGLEAAMPRAASSSNGSGASEGAGQGQKRQYRKGPGRRVQLALDEDESSDFARLTFDALLPAEMALEIFQKVRKVQADMHKGD